MKIVIAGAGSIGCYVGGRLMARSHDVVLLGRPSLQEEIKASGLTLTDLGGHRISLSPKAVSFTTDLAAVKGADAVIITVKSKDTAEIADGLAPHLSPGAVVISLQNGVRNAETAAAHLPERTVLAAMVPFNVLYQGKGHFHCGTTGDIFLAEHPLSSRLAEALGQAGIGARTHANMKGILWSKLVMNLNNAINALVDIPLREELSQRGFRRILSACMSEALLVLSKAGVKLERFEGVPLPVVPWLLKLPDAIFTRVSRSIINIDPKARSSMWEDVTRGRVTEVDYLNGEVAALARSRGERAPINEAIVGLIREAEAAKRSPRLSMAELGTRLGIVTES